MLPRESKTPSTTMISLVTSPSTQRQNEYRVEEVRVDVVVLQPACFQPVVPPLRDRLVALARKHVRWGLECLAQMVGRCTIGQKQGR